MPRKPRILADETLYHVYSRVSRREGIFAQEGEPEAFVELLREIKARDGLEILAWCLMTNHLHLLVRTGAVPLSRSMRSVQGRFAVSYNRRHALIGPLWQSRYKAKPVSEDAYFRRLVAYVHLNPVAAGIVERPALYRWSGHAELIGRRKPELVDVARTLELFDPDPGQARLAYLRLVAALRKERKGRPVPRGWERAEVDRAGEWDPPPAGCQAVRAPLPDLPTPRDISRFVDEAAAALGIPRQTLGGHRQDRAVTRAREALVLVATERHRLRLSDLARELGKSADTLAHWVSRAGRRRVADPAFASAVEALAARLN
jgi:REP element-mobilizing transposase RayT